MAGFGGRREQRTSAFSPGVRDEPCISLSLLVILGCRMKRNGRRGRGLRRCGIGPRGCTAPRSISSGNHALRRRT